MSTKTTAVSAVLDPVTTQSDFKSFKTALALRWSWMQQYPLYRVNVSGQDVWDRYLAAFPEGTDPMYRERTEHNCSACRSFIKAVGNVVALVDGDPVSIWDAHTALAGRYSDVAKTMAGISSLPISDVFLHYEAKAGVEKTFEEITVQKMSGVSREAKTWEHFCVNINQRFVKKRSDIPTLLAGPRESKNVLLRALLEIDTAAVNTVLELIDQGSLYRGEEHRYALKEFRALRVEFEKRTIDAAADRFAWQHSAFPVARIRNTVIGTLLVDIASGVDLEDAVKSFEAKVAPHNYKRPTALVTQGMVDKAKATVEGLGLTSALQRRHATEKDVTANNVLFVNRDVRTIEAEDAFSGVATASAKQKSLDKVEEIGIEKFLADVLPHARSLEVMLENRHTGNLVSLIAPEDPTAGRMFKWDNGFSWSYNGEVADSVKERVKAAGGTVTGDLCCRLAWDYADDLDFHMHEPGKGKLKGHEIYYSNRRVLSPSGGMLDLDANGIDGIRPDPAENIFYADRRKMAEGIYQLSVHNYSRRSDGRGFVVEIEFDGQVHRIEYGKVLASGNTSIVAKIKYVNGVFEIVESLPSSQTSRQAWGLQTQAFHPVSMLMLSPNHWDDRAVGNKHYMFMLDGCRNDGQARGFFNEFLREDLTPHRKVLEIVGGRTKIEPTDGQLSGLGFSSTVRNSIVCRVKGSFTRVVKVIF